MRTSFIHISAAAVISLSLGACSPVVLPEDTDSGSSGTDSASTGGTDGAETDSATGGGEGGNEGMVPAACVDLVPRVKGILETNCAKCHGAGSAAQGGINYILDLNELIVQNKVIPGDSAASRVYARMTSAMTPMPPPTEMQRPNPTDIEIVGKWIDECAGVQSCADQPFIPREQMLQAINQDLGTIALQTQPFTRYFSFVDLYNAGWCDAEIELFREALSKLVNSLSRNTEIIAPVAIDKERLIFRVDIGDYAWEAVDGKQFRLSEPSFYFRDDEQTELDKRFSDVWEMMADQNPYTVEYIGDVAINIKKTTGTNFPILPGAAFIDVTSRSPLYYDILGIPKRSVFLPGTQDNCTPDTCLEAQLGIRVLDDINKEILEDKDIVGRAGFKKSDVSEFNRVVERHRLSNANNRVFWISYDFKGQKGDQNILAHPLDFKFDGGEIIFTLENGLQGYMLTDKLGNRLNDGPLEIVQDPSQIDQVVRNGVSCMGCHSAGMIKVNDDIRYGLDAGTLGGVFDDKDLDAIKKLYPKREDFDKLQQQDTDRFNFSLGIAGVTVGSAKEPIITTFLSFDEDVTLRRVGAEYDRSESDMLKKLALLGDDFSDLAEGATIHRKDFTAGYSEGACTLKIGCTRSCPGKGAGADRICLFTDTDNDGVGDQP